MTTQDKNVAFLIVAHGDIVHLRRLCEKISPYDTFVHWDAKSGLPPSIERVVFTQRRLHVFWAGFSQVDATIELIRTALSSGRNYTHLVLMSGSCYPIRPVEDFVQHCANARNCNLMNMMRVSESDFLHQQVQRRYWRDGVLPYNWRRSPRLLKIERFVRAVFNLLMSGLPKRRAPIDIFHGSQWWALTLTAAKYAVQVYENDSKLVKFFKFTFASDDKFFHSVLRNSEHVSSLPPLTDVGDSGVARTANFHVIDPSLAKWYGIDDLNVIQGSDKFFIRKVRTESSSELLDWIDANRLERI